MSQLKLTARPQVHKVKVSISSIFTHSLSPPRK